MKVIRFSFPCSVKQNKKIYTVSFRYRKKDGKIVDWIEG
ncbi:ComG operon protein 7 [Bacillus cereus G9842]|uniref:ComG operon protein 7 n=1 Tax=Bacillus cereus (strain G9842) TaxID=405531 RepID=B7IXM4_BACC2|nr:ComG operon protein 7 [Bacillus cereus G9842]